MRSRKSVTPEASAERAKRKVAVRSSARGAPAISIKAAPRLPHLAASTPTRNTASASRPITSDRAAGSTPNSASPTPFSRPASHSRKSCRAQSNGRPDAAREARARPKPIAADQSAPMGACTSCRQERLSPPPRKASTFCAPRTKRSERSDVAARLPSILASVKRKAAKVFPRDGEAPRHALIPCMVYTNVHVMFYKKAKSFQSQAGVCNDSNFYHDLFISDDANTKKPPGRSRAGQQRSLTPHMTKTTRRTRFANALRPRPGAN